jgi:hypothetical protein
MKNNMTESEQKWIETNRSACAVLRQLHDMLALSSLPPRRTWVGLTDVEWMNIVNKDQAWFGQRPDEVAHEVAKMVEAKLKEKNT